MNRVITLGILAALFASTSDAYAVDFNFQLFRRKPATPKAEPSGKVKQLITTLQSDLDEKKRRAAAEELSTIDPRNSPDVIPALIATLQKDPAPAVRIQAVESIGKLKPVVQQAGIALETALQSDPDPKVREAVKAALFQYHLNGYRPPTNSPLASQTGEPPLAGPKPSATGFRPITNTVGKLANPTQTAEPPLARPKPKTPAIVPPAPASTPGPAPAPKPRDPAPTIPVPNTNPPSASPPPAGLPPVSVPTIPTIPTPPPSKPGF